MTTAPWAGSWVYWALLSAVFAGGVLVLAIKR